MTKFLKPIFLILGMATLLYNCQRNNVTDASQTEIDNSAFKIRTVKLTEIPTIKSFLTNKSKTNIFSQKTIIDGAIFDQDNIMEVIDTLNQTNYSFRFTYPSTPRGVYYNLVVGKSPEGELKAPYVLKYVTDDAYTDTFIESNYDFRFFKGTVGLHKFTDYFQQGGAFKTEADTFCPPEYDANGDPIACDNLSLDGSGFNTSSGGGTSGGSSGGGSIGFTTCTIVTYAPCGCGGNADGHAPSGVPCCQGSPTILELSCPPYQKMSQTKTGLKTNGTVDCPTCPTGGNGGVGVNLGDVVLSDLIINTLNLSLKDPKTLWLNSVATTDELLAISNFLGNNNNSVEAIAFINDAIEALMNGIYVDFEEAYIGEDYQDDNYIFQGVKNLIPNPLVLSNGDTVNVTFVTYTSDNKSSNQKVAVELVNSIKFALEQANNSLSTSDKITSINVYATTNGDHTGPNHYNGTAIDINRINGKRMAITGLTNQIKELQKGFDNFQYIRENFGPYFKHKYDLYNNTWNYNYSVSGHKDHIHISVRK